MSIVAINAMPAGPARLRAALSAQASGGLPDNSIVLDDGSIVDGAASATIDDDVVAAAQAIEDVILDRPRHDFRSGTVVGVEGAGYGKGRAVASVNIDGDPSTVITPCGVMVAAVIGAGDRVLIAFDPPHAHYVIGIDGLKTPVCKIAWEES